MAKMPRDEAHRERQEARKIQTSPVILQKENVHKVKDGKKTVPNYLLALLVRLGRRTLQSLKSSIVIQSHLLLHISNPTCQFCFGVVIIALEPTTPNSLG